MSDPDGVETNVSSFASDLKRMSSEQLYQLVDDIKDQSQDGLIIREVLLRLLSGYMGRSISFQRQVSDEHCCCCTDTRSSVDPP